MTALAWVVGLFGLVAAGLHLTAARGLGESLSMRTARRLLAIGYLTASIAAVSGEYVVAMIALVVIEIGGMLAPLVHLLDQNGKT